MSIVELPPSGQNVPGETCPRCHTTKSWGGASWCPSCSYYPLADGKVSEGSPSWADDLPDVVEETADNRGAIESISMWFWVMLTGIVGLAAGSVAIRLSFSEDQGLRGMIALIQAGAGLISALTAHGIASYHALKDNRRLNLNDVMLSWFSIWQPTITQLPKTAKRILAVAWGATAFLTAVTIIGGIDYSAPLRVHQQSDVKTGNLIGAVGNAAKQQNAGDVSQSMEEAGSNLAEGTEDTVAEGAGSMKQALNELGGTEESLQEIGNGAEEQAKNAEEILPVYTTQCVVYGVEVDAKRIPVALLIAARTTGKLQHVGRIERKDISHRDFQYMGLKLQKAVVRDPILSTSRKAIWVKPVVSCRVAFNGLDDNGELKNPKFEASVLSEGLPDFKQTTKLKEPAE